MPRKETIYIDGVHAELQPRKNTKGQLVWYVGIPSAQKDSKGRRSYIAIRSTKESVKQRAIEKATEIVREISERAERGDDELHDFLTSMWTWGSQFLTIRSKQAKTGKRISEHHAQNCKRLLERHFLPYCKRYGVHTFDDITPQFLTDWMVELSTKGTVDGGRPIGLSSVEKVRKTLNVSLKYAVMQQRIKLNPLQAMDDLKVGASQEEVKKAHRQHIPMPWLVKIFKPEHWSEHWALTMAYVSTITGAREGELRALQWRYVDLDNGMIYIRASWSNFTKKSKAAKSARGERDLPIDETGIAYLRKQRERLQWNDDTDLVFPGTERGRPVSGSRGLYHLRQAAKRAGVKLDPEKHVFHSLRHTFASYTSSMSDDSRTMFMGHSDLSMTEGYTHVTEAQIKELRETQRKMFSFVDTA